MKLLRLDDSTHSLVKISVAVALVLFVVMTRIVPHPANFVPVAAVALFGGALLPRRWAIVVPVAAMVASDLIVGLHPLVMYTWGSFALIAFASSKWLSQATVTRVGLSSLGASVVFYLVTNFGVWLQGLMYPMTTAGLVHCYVNALPFFRNTLAGDLFYVGVLFGSYAVVTHLVEQRSNVHHRVTA